MTTIREAICKALETKKGKKETEEDFIGRISSDAFTDEQWDALAAADNGTEAQEFANAVTTALKDGAELPAFPDEVHEDPDTDEEEESEGETSASEDTNHDNDEKELDKKMKKDSRSGTKLKKTTVKATKVAKAKKGTVEAKKAKKTNGGVRGEKIKEIVKLLTRSGGCTAKDVLEATGWPSVSMPAMAKQAGLTLNKKKIQGEVTRYSAK